MANLAHGGASALPLTLLAQAIPRLSRNDLERLAERLIDELDNNGLDYALRCENYAQDDSRLFHPVNVEETASLFSRTCNERDEMSAFKRFPVDEGFRLTI